MTHRRTKLEERRFGLTLSHAHRGWVIGRPLRTSSSGPRRPIPVRGEPKMTRGRNPIRESTLQFELLTHAAPLPSGMNAVTIAPFSRVTT